MPGLPMSSSPREVRAVSLPLRRELIWIGVALVLGFVVMPPLIWLVGTHVLGPYTPGGIGALWGQFFRGLASGSFAFWYVAIGPYFLLLLLRALIRLFRARGEPEPPPPPPLR